MTGVINLREKLGLIEDLWHPRIVAQVDGYHVKLVRLQGEFVWHKHDEQDEMFLVVAGQFKVRLSDGERTLREGELFVVPKGVEHCPYAEEEACVLLLERSDTDQMGGVETGLRADQQEWI